MGPFTVGQIPAQDQAFNITDSKGAARDLTGFASIHMILVDPSDSVISEASLGTIAPISGATPNQIVLHWNRSASVFVNPGTYEYQFKMVNADGSTEYTPSYYFKVRASATVEVDTWAHVGDVMNITGVTVSDDHCTQAQSIIEDVVHRLYSDTSAFRVRDSAYLKKAVAYQAVFVMSHPDLFTRTAFDSVSGDGQAVKLSSKASVYLAPLAMRAIKNLSWMKSRSLRMKTPFIDGDMNLINPLVDDTRLIWERM